MLTNRAALGGRLGPQGALAQAACRRGALRISAVGPKARTCLLRLFRRATGAGLWNSHRLRLWRGVISRLGRPFGLPIKESTIIIPRSH